MPRPSQFDPQREKYIQEGVSILRQQEENGQTPNVRAVKQQLDEKYQTDVPYGTLYNRFHGLHQAAPFAHAKQMLLTPEQEAALVQWIILLSDAANPVSKRSLRRMAELLCGKRPGSTWVRAFLARHPDIKLARPSGLDPKRAQAFNRPVVEHYFQLLLELVERIPPERRYNMDEKGCQRGGGRKAQQRKYFVSRNRRPKYKYRSDNLELVTIIECVCADGTALTPGFVFSGTQYCEEWFDARYPGLCVSLSENGWTSDTICLEWFQKSFIPQVREKHPGNDPILLIYDGHGSHETLELLKLAKANNIILLSLPPHTTHRLQPLDVGVFGPFSRAWTERCDEIIETEGREMPRERFVQEYMDVRNRLFKPSTIITAWRKSGATPVNPSVFDNTDYAPSLATSYANTIVPPSFPIQPSFYNDDVHDKLCEHCQEDQEDDEEDDGSTTDDVSLPLPSTSTSQQSITTPSPITPSHSFTASDPPAPPTCARTSQVPPTIRSQYRTKDEYIAALEKEVAGLRSENSTLGAHCHLVYDQYVGLKRKVNAREQRPSKRRKVNVNARCLTTEEFLAEREKENDERLAEEARKEAERNAKEAEQRERQSSREARDKTLPFTGSLKSKNKEDLKDIAYNLGLSLEGTNREIVSRIEAYFVSHPEVRRSPVYAGLTLSSSRGHRGNMTADAFLPSDTASPSSPATIPLHGASNFNTTSISQNLLNPDSPYHTYTSSQAGPSSSYISLAYNVHNPYIVHNNSHSS